MRFSAIVRGQEVADWAGAWLRVDTVLERARAFDNMEDRPLRGSTDWMEAANVLDVAEEAASVHFGVLLTGAGAVDLARPRFEVVGPDVPLTRNLRKPLPAGPHGLDFGTA